MYGDGNRKLAAHAGLQVSQMFPALRVLQKCVKLKPPNLLQVSCSAFHPASGMLVVGLTSGMFEMYQLPGARGDLFSLMRAAAHREPIASGLKSFSLTTLISQPETQT